MSNRIVISLAILIIVTLFTKQSLQQSQQESSRRQQQKQLIEPAILLDGSQASSNSFNNGEYSSLVADNLINLGQPFFNNKRARKISAFMPMRGKKSSTELTNGNINEQLDGGSEQFLSSSGQNFVQPLLMQLRESDGDSSIFRLVMANNENNNNNNELNNRAAEHQKGPIQAASLFGLGTPAPRQFTNQFAARHLMLAPTPSVYGNEAFPNPLESSFASGGGLSSMGLSSSSINGESNQMMQAKLRRAFHPMRGKKSLRSWPASFMQELGNYPDNMQMES